MLLQWEIRRWSFCSLKLVRNYSLLCRLKCRPTSLEVTAISKPSSLWRGLRCSPIPIVGVSSPCIHFKEQQRRLTTSHKLLKKKGSFKKYDDLNENENEDEETDELLMFSDKKHTKEFNASSTRLDTILKSGLGYSRKFVDQAFYESRVMLNGKKVLKKSDTVRLGDEVDIVHGYHPDNSKFLLVSRVELKAVEAVDDDAPEEGLRIKVFRHKNIKIDNYSPPWKSSGGS